MEKAKEEINEKKRQIRMLEQRIKSAVTSQPIANAFEMSQVHFSGAMIWSLAQDHEEVRGFECFYMQLHLLLGVLE